MQNSAARINVETPKPIPRSDIPRGWNTSVPAIMEMGRQLADKHSNLSLDEFDAYRKSLLIDQSTARKLIQVAKHRILSDPANANKLPPQWGKLYELSFLPDGLLQEMIDSGRVLTITKYHIWRLRGPTRKSKFTKAVVDGKKAVLRRGLTEPPEGMSILSWIRSGLRLENNGLQPDEAAKAIGLGKYSYRQGRAIALLAERTDLSPSDMALVKEAIKQIELTKNINRYYDDVLPIVNKVWGAGKGGRRGIYNRGGSDEKRKQAFLNAVIHISDTCTSSMSIEIPFLSTEEMDLALTRATEAQTAVRDLVKRLWRLKNERKGS